jgi:hypothetical protein
MTRELFVPSRRPIARRSRSRGLLSAVAAALVLSAAHFAAAQAVVPPPSTDLGAPNRAAAVNTSFNLNPFSVVWFSFSVPEVSTSSGLFLDIDTEGTQLSPFNDSMIALYDSAGNLIVVNDDSGTGALSALSFGLDTPARPGFDGGQQNGQNGSLAGGTYYLAVLGFNGFNTFGPNFAVTSSAQTNGFAQVHLRLGPAAAFANAGTDLTTPENALVALDGSASRGVDICDPSTFQLSWTQIAGPTVILNQADILHPTFTSPEVGAGGATLTFQLDATSCLGGTVSDFVNVSVTNLNRAPVAEAGPDQTVAEGSTVALDGSQSYDLDDNALTFFWSQVSGPAVTLSSDSSPAPTFVAPFVGQAGGTVRLALAVSDGEEIAVDFIDVVIQNINHPPVASAGPCFTADESTLVTLNGGGSSDPDNDFLTYSWQQICGPTVTLSGASTATPTFTAPNVSFFGALLTFRLTVSDGLLSRTDNVSVYIRQTFSPPDCTTARPSDDSLWPPNHKLVPIRILGLCSSGVGLVNVTITSVTQDEPIRGTGNGDTGPDAVIQCDTVLLRAERKESGNGRVYRINFTATSLGGACTGSVKVVVPRNQSHGGTATDDGQIYNSVGP